MKTVKTLEPRWYTTKQVAEILNFGLSKTKALVTANEIKSVKAGKYRRILPEWVDEYVERKVAEVEAQFAEVE